MTDPSSSFLPSFTPLEPPRYEEIRVTFPADRARQLHRPRDVPRVRALQPPPRRRGPRGWRREGVHHLRRAEVWAECSGAWDLADSSAVSYDEYLDRGVCDDRHAEQRERIRRDVPAVFPNHPRFVRAAADARGRGSGGAEAGDAASSRYSARSDGTCAAMSVSNASSVSNARPRAGTACSARSSACWWRRALGHREGRVALRRRGDAPFGDGGRGGIVLDPPDVPRAPRAVAVHALAGGARRGDARVRRRGGARFPRAGAKLRAAGVSRPSLLVAGWFTRLGVGVLPGEASLRLWDALVLEGGDVLTQAALAFVRLHGDALVSVPESDGAALLDAAEELAAAQFAFGPLVSHAVDACEAARENAAWLRCRADRRAETARNAAAVGRLRELIHAFRNADANVDAPGGDGDFFGGEGERGEGERASASASPSEGGVPTSSPSVTRRAFREMVRDAFSFSGEEVHSEAAVAALRAFDVAAKTKANASTLSAEDGGVAAVRGRRLSRRRRRTRRRTKRGFPFRSGRRRAILSTRRRRLGSRWRRSAAIRPRRACATSSRGTSVARRRLCARRTIRTSGRRAPRDWRRRFARRAQRFSARPRAVGRRRGGGGARERHALRPGRRALARIRQARPEGRVRPRRRVGGGVAAGSDALPLPGRRRPARRRTSRGSPRANRVAFEVSVAGSRDVAPSMGGLFFSWPPRAPHASYQLLVQTPGAAAPRRVEKRFNDFRRLHLDAEAEGVTRVAGSALALPDLGSLAFAQSTDPSVKAAREVGLQRYLDVLAASGSPEANRVLRAFLGVRGEEEASTPSGAGKGAFGGEEARQERPRRARVVRRRDGVRAGAEPRGEVGGEVLRGETERTYYS